MDERRKTNDKYLNSVMCCIQANGGKPGLPVYIREDCDPTHELLEPWWMDRGDYKLHPLSHDLCQSDHDKERRGEYESASPDPSDMTSDNKSFKFTEYSLSSSVVPRSEGQSY